MSQTHITYDNVMRGTVSALVSYAGFVTDDNTWTWVQPYEFGVITYDTLNGMCIVIAGSVEGEGTGEKSTMTEASR